MYLVRQILLPLKIPLALSASGELLHAMPRDAFTVFATVGEAESAIRCTLGCPGRSDAEFEILDLNEYEASQDAEARKNRRVAKAAKQAKGEAA